MPDSATVGTASTSIIQNSCRNCATWSACPPCPACPACVLWSVSVTAPPYTPWGYDEARETKISSHEDSQGTDRDRTADAVPGRRTMARADGPIGPSPFSADWELATADRHLQYTDALLPFQPLSFSDFLLSAEHNIAAARGMINRFYPASSRITTRCRQVHACQRFPRSSRRSCSISSRSTTCRTR